MTQTKPIKFLPSIPRFAALIAASIWLVSACSTAIPVNSGVSIPGGGTVSLPGGGGSSGGGSSGGGSSGGGSSGGGMGMPGGGSSGGGMGGMGGGMGMPGGGSSSGSSGGSSGGGMQGGGSSGGGAGSTMGGQSSIPQAGVPGGGAAECNDGGISGGGIGGGAGCDPDRAGELGKELDKSVGDFDEALGEEQRQVSSVGRNTEGFGSQSGNGSGGTISLGEQAAGAEGGSGGAGGGSGGAAGSGETQAGPLDGMSDEELQSRTPDDIDATTYDDIVARQLREAALAEDDPALRERLWEEYRKYKGMK